MEVLGTAGAKNWTRNRGDQGQSFAYAAKVLLTVPEPGLPLHRSLAARTDGDNVWELLPFWSWILPGKPPPVNERRMGEGAGPATIAP